MDRKKIKKAVVWSVIIIAAILLFNAKNIAAYVDYKAGIKYMDQGEYKLAEKAFSENFNYRNSRSLYYFSQYMQVRDDTDRGYFDMYMIPESYNGEFADVIKEERAAVEKRHKAYLNEKAEQEKQRDAKERAELKNKLPYKGMDTKYIGDTLVGQYDKVSDGYDYEEGKDSNVKRYYWYSDDGKDVVLTVTARYDPNRYRYYVEKTEKNNTDIYWTADGRPNFGAKRPVRTTSKPKYDYDDVWGYDNPEDLYYDNPDMFEGYEEAEDFFNDMIGE